MHYIFDAWMARERPDLPWCRYADDGLVHCRTEAEAVAMKAALAARLAGCQLEMHPEKTKIVYCKDGKRRSNYPNTKFDFLGYCFRTRAAINRKRKLFTGFGPQVSASSLKAMRQKIRELNLRRRTHVRLADIAQAINPILQGWLNYYGRYAPGCNAFGVEVCQCDTDCVGDAEVQALRRTKNTGWPNDWFHCHQAAQTVLTLASKQGRRVCLMGAV